MRKEVETTLRNRIFLYTNRWVISSNCPLIPGGSIKNEGGNIFLSREKREKFGPNFCVRSFLIPGLRCIFFLSCLFLICHGSIFLLALHLPPPHVCIPSVLFLSTTKHNNTKQSVPTSIRGWMYAGSKGCACVWKRIVLFVQSRKEAFHGQLSSFFI